MTDLYNNPMLDTNLNPERDLYKDLSDEECFSITICQIAGYILSVVLAFILCAIFSSCTTQRIIEQHHHHYYEADTLAMQAKTDTRLSDNHIFLDSLTRTLFDQYSASWFAHDDEKEVTTETVTTITDSLGRAIRTEQRTTERTLSRQQQQTEQRLSKEFDRRIRVAVDSVNGIWQQRFDVLQAHYEQADSTASSVQSAGVFAGDNIPWYKLWWQSMKDYLLIAAIIILLLMTRNIWLPWCINIFRRA
jgi:hypothetical protein